MRVRVCWIALAAGLAGAGCNTIVGNADHQVAPVADAASPADAGGGADASLVPDSPTGDAATDAAPEGSPGGPVPPTSGGIFSVGRVPDEAGTGILPSGATVMLTDDGFEFGETLCNGTTCVTGAITP